MSLSDGDRTCAQRGAQRLGRQGLGSRIELPDGPDGVAQVLEVDLEPHPSIGLILRGADNSCVVEQLVATIATHPDGDRESRLGQEGGATFCPDPLEVGCLGLCAGSASTSAESIRDNRYVRSSSPLSASR